jgi:hypothetical protein
VRNHWKESYFYNSDEMIEAFSALLEAQQVDFYSELSIIWTEVE